MESIGAFAAKNTLGSLLDRVEAGEEILITRHGKPCARLTAPLPEFDREKARVAAERIQALAKEARARAALDRMSERADGLKMGAFDWEEWKAYRDEGRR